MDDSGIEQIVEKAVMRALQRSDHVARLSETELNAVALRVADVLEERLFPALAEPQAEAAPRSRRAKRRGYFKPQ